MHDITLGILRKNIDLCTFSKSANFDNMLKFQLLENLYSLAIFKVSAFNASISIVLFPNALSPIHGFLLSQA